MDRASDCDEITFNGVSNKELQMMCRGEWLNDNVRTLCGYPGRAIASIFISDYHSVPSDAKERSTRGIL